MFVVVSPSQRLSTFLEGFSSMNLQQLVKKVIPEGKQLPVDTQHPLHT